MSGSKYLFDTNAVIALLGGNKQLLQLSGNASWLGISIITKLEFLSFSKLSKHDINLFSEFEKRIEIIGINNEDVNLIDYSIILRKKYNLKLPDAIIAATAIKYKSSLVTADKEFNKIKNITLCLFE